MEWEGHLTVHISLGLVGPPDHWAGLVLPGSSFSGSMLALLATANGETTGLRPWASLPDFCVQCAKTPALAIGDGSPRDVLAAPQCHQHSRQFTQYDPPQAQAPHASFGC